jgi:hypothetical protein
MDPTIEWSDESTGRERKLSCHRPSGYEARILVSGNQLSARVWKPHEARDAFVVSPKSYADTEIEPTVSKVKAEIEQRLQQLENGHS